MAGLSNSRKRVILFLSDGMMDSRGKEGITEKRQILSEITVRNVQAIPIHSICIGEPGQVDADWMHALSARSGGSFARLERFDGL